MLEIGGASTYQEMDKLFQNYCKEQSSKSKTTTNSAVKSMNFARALSGTNFAKVPNIKHIEVATPVANRKSVIEQHSMLSINPDKNDVFPLPNTDKDDDFVSKIHSLTLKNNGTWNLSDDEINQLAQEFGLSISVLLSLNTQEEKHKYIVDCMRKAINDDLKEFNKKHHAKTIHHSNFDAEYLKHKEKLENDNADIFSWLHIHTKHEALKKKLRSRLAETINDQENQNIIETNLEEIRNSTKDMSRSSSLLKKIRLENIPVIDNIEILQGMLDGKSDNLLKMTKSVKQANRTLDSTINSNTATKESVPIHHHQQEKLAETESTVFNQWDPSKEETFLQYREDAKSRLFDKIKSSNWNELGFSPMVQASVKDEKSKLQRDTKLASYMNGDLLTPEEYKLLASTSVTLNRFVDKKYLQTVVNYLDPEVMEAIETDLAENTLKDYEKRQQDMRGARLEYIKEHNKALAQSIDHKNQLMQNHMKVAEGKQEQMKIKRRALSMLSKAEERKKWRENSAKMIDDGPKTPNVDIEHFADKFLKVVDEKISNRKLQKAQNFLKRLLPYQPKQSPIDLDVSRHYFHPSSKIIVKNNNRSNDYLGLGTDNLNPAIAKRKNDKVENFKLHIHSSPVFKINRNFKRFYSGGPEDDDTRVFQGNYIIGDVSTYKVDKAKERIVLKIQAAWRGFMQRKAFRQIQERVKERNRAQGRIGYLKNYTSSPFLKTVLTAQDKFNFKKIKTKLNQTDTIKEKPISLSNLSPSSKVLDSGKRNSKASHDLKMMLQSDVDKIQKSYQSPVNRMDSNPRSLENIDQFTRKDNSKLAKINESLEFAQIHKTFSVGRPKTAIVSPSNTLSRAKNSGYNTPKPPNDYESDGFAYGDASVEANRLAKIVKRGAPKGLLLKQRKLFIAAKTGNFNLIQSSGFNYYEGDVNTKDEQGNSPLFYAAKNGSKEVCDFLVRHKAYVNEPCSNGNTPLHMAFSSGQIMVVILLISYGGNLNILNQHGQTPVAFGSDNLLALLDLKDATATYHNNYGKVLPSELDNNRFLKRFQTKPDTDQDQLSFNYKNLDRNLGKIASETK